MLAPSSDGQQTCTKEKDSNVNLFGISPANPTHGDPNSRRDDDVVISGISCRLPQSDNMAEFKDNLLNGIDMVTETDPRWKPGFHGLPRRAGLIKDLSKFDAEFFGVSPKQANRMDPQIRILLEVTHESIVDAGVDPETIRGTQTGVFVGAISADSHVAWSADPETTSGYTLTGCCRSMLANRLSFHFDFKGPSYSIDTACSSGLLAMDQALHSIRSGQCDAAIVAGSNLCLRPSTSLQFHRLGMLSPQGMCKSFDADADGYCRSEGIVALYLQRESVAKRLYCTLVHSKTKTDGYKEKGITFPSAESQKSLLHDVYSEACVDPASVVYLEAHGTGTKAGDPVEVNALCDVFCKDRESTLPIGTVKSNMGHCEPTSGLSAVAKVIVAMETEIIPGNLHYNTPSPDIPGLQQGKLQVVNSNKTWQGGIVGVNSAGFGGSNVHAILKSKPMNKTREEKPAEIGKRLFLYSSRSEEGLNEMLQRVRDHPEDLNFHALVNETAFMSPKTHAYRGFTVLNGKNDVYVQKVSPDRCPVWYVFSGMGTQWCGMGRKMMDIDVFKASILKSDTLLKPLGVQLYQLLMNDDKDVLADVVNSFVGIVAIQIALVDVLTKIGIRPDGIVGHSVGELGCAYADGGFTAEQTVLAAYWRGRCIQNADLPPGGMAAVGLTWEGALEQCPPGVVPACHNAKDTVTVSGPKDAVSQFVSDLKQKQVFAKKVDSAGVAFHSTYMEGVAPAMKAALDQIIKTPKARSNRWISSSIRRTEWSSDLAKYSSSDYHVNNLVSPVLFQEALGHVPDNAIVIEIAPHCLLQAILKRSLSKECCIEGLMKKGHEDNGEFCLTTLGRCYQFGVNLDPLKLCPPVTFPVPAGTSFVSPLVRWNHSNTWDVPTQESFIGGSSGSSRGYDIDISPESENRQLADHIIDGHTVFPGAGYLVLAWKTLAHVAGVEYQQLPVTFKDISFVRSTLLPETGKVHFDVNLLPGTGDFVIVEEGTVAATGKVLVLDASDADVCEKASEKESVEYSLASSDIYKEVALRGYDYGQAFKGIVRADIAVTNGQLRWNGDWITFLDTMMQMIIMSKQGTGLCLPTRIKTVTIDPITHLNTVKDLEGETTKGVDVTVDLDCDVCTAGHVKILGLHTALAQRHDVNHPIHETCIFVPNQDTSTSLPYCSKELNAYVHSCSSRSLYLLKRFLKNPTPGTQTREEYIQTAIVESPLEETIGEENQIADDNHGYLKLLNEADDIFTRHGKGNIEYVIHDRFESLSNDVMLNHLYKQEFLRHCFDVVVENTKTNPLRVLEITDFGMTNHLLPLSTTSQPLLQTTFIVSTHNTMLAAAMEEKDGVELLLWSPVSQPPPSFEKVHLAIADNVLHKQSNIVTGLCNITECVEDGGFILVKEVTQKFHLAFPLDGIHIDEDKYTDLNNRTCGIYCTAEKWRTIFSDLDFNIIFERSDAHLSTMFLLRKASTCLVDRQTLVNVTDPSFIWVEELKEEILECETKPKKENLWLVAEKNLSGILGMVTCLRKEPGGDRIRCILNCGSEPLPDVQDVLEAVQSSDLVMNVYKNGQWGSYRQQALPPVPSCKSQHAVVNVLIRGDLSSLTWVQSPLRYFRQEDSPDSYLCTVHYATLNFRDVMLATGKLPPDAIPGNLVNQECLLGMEFSGVCSTGARVMGIVPSKGLATTVEVKARFMWDIPDTWSLVEAATVPVVYATAYYALVVRGNIRHCENVLIHSGSGGVGQAAISIALHYGCEVFTTVGSKEKKDYLKARFQALTGKNIFNSRDTSFEAGVLKATRGYGVDIVLNSLSEEKLQASLRVLAQHGRFLEIGKVDLSNNTPLGMSIFLKNISFHGILLDALFENGNRDLEVVSQCLKEGIETGVVRPLRTSLFTRDEVESAFRFMARGKQIGKVVIRIQDEASDTPVSVPAVPRFACDPAKCYIVTGGIGSIGLELSGWLIERGARHLILTSRSGVSTGYQARKLQYFKAQGVEVTVSTRNVCMEEDVKFLLTETSYPVGGVFHLAMETVSYAYGMDPIITKEIGQSHAHLFNLAPQVLKDGLLENLDQDAFKEVCLPKVTGTINLDKMTRDVCKETCDWFVVFSSIISRQGNSGQANYGFANSFMERVCEKRCMDGFHGLAIQWGPFSDVGVAFESKGSNDMVIADTTSQSVASCLASLDLFLNQSEPVVSNFVPAKLKTTSQGGPCDKADAVAAVFHILGIADPSNVNPNLTLSDLGLDSLMGVEVKQALKRGFDISMTLKEIRHVTVNTLRKIPA